MSSITGYGGSGANTAIVETPSNANGATNLVVRGCSFYNTRTLNRYHNFAVPIRCASNAFLVGTNIVEDVYEATQTNIYRNVSTSFRPGSVFRNNAYPNTTVFSGGSAARQVTNYQLIGGDGLFVADNVAFAAPPDFVCTNDIYSPDFCRYRSSRTDALNLGVLGWRGENNEYPPWIGALPPLYPAAAMMILR